MNSKDMEIFISDDDKDIKNPILDYPYICKEIMEVIDHLQDVISKAQSNTLTTGLLKVRIGDSLRHLNRAYNLRIPNSASHTDADSASKLSIDIVKELGFTSESIVQYIYNDSKITDNK